jgi:hypothetical protein
MTDKAVSEIIGFIIVFGIVVTSIGIVYSNAVPQLQESREIENVQNSQRAFSVLQNNINDVAVRDVPARGTQIRLQGSTIELRPAGEGYINVTVEKSGDKFFMNTTYRPLVYTNTNDLRIVYENGAVFRSIRDGGSGMSYKPNWRINEDEVVLPIIKTKGSRTSAGGTSTILIRAENAGTETNVTESVDNINVTVKSPRADGWELYMQEFASDGLAEDPVRSGDVVYMEIPETGASVDPDLIHVQNDVDMGIER